IHGRIGVDSLAVAEALATGRPVHADAGDPQGKRPGAAANGAGDPRLRLDGARVIDLRPPAGELPRDERDARIRDVLPCRVGNILERAEDWAELPGQPGRDFCRAHFQHLGELEHRIEAERDALGEVLVERALITPAAGVRDAFLCETELSLLALPNSSQALGVLTLLWGEGPAVTLG